MEKIYLYTTDQNKKAQIQNISGSLGIKVEELKPKDLSRTIGEITGLMKSRTAAEKSAAVIPAFYQMPEVMLCFGMTGERLDTFLKVWKMSGIQPVGLKAMVTPYNMSWALVDLIDELKKEQRKFAK